MRRSKEDLKHRKIEAKLRESKRNKSRYSKKFTKLDSNNRLNVGSTLTHTGLKRKQANPVKSEARGLKFAGKVRNSTPRYWVCPRGCCSHTKLLRHFSAALEGGAGMRIRRKRHYSLHDISLNYNLNYVKRFLSKFACEFEKHCKIAEHKSPLETCQATIKRLIAPPDLLNKMREDVLKNKFDKYGLKPTKEYY